MNSTSKAATGKGAPETRKVYSAGWFHAEDAPSIVRENVPAGKPVLIDNDGRYGYPVYSAGGYCVQMLADVATLEHTKAVTGQRLAVASEGNAPRVLKQGTPVLFNGGYRGAIIRQYDGGMYEIRGERGSVCTEDFEIDWARILNEAQKHGSKLLAARESELKQVTAQRDEWKATAQEYIGAYEDCTAQRDELQKLCDVKEDALTRLRAAYCKLETRNDELLAACKWLADFSYTDFAAKYSEQSALQELVAIKRKARRAIAKVEESPSGRPEGSAQ